MKYELGDKANYCVLNYLGSPFYLLSFLTPTFSEILALSIVREIFLKLLVLPKF